jgi:MFS transporter, DHA1 family, multidrug resistance protein
MIKQPIFRNFSPKIYQYILSVMVILMYICVCAEADIYVPAFPQMIKYFGVAENEIQLVLGVNFLSLCLAAIIVGPLSDTYGRRKVILYGLAFFMLTSIVLVAVDDFKTLLYIRFAQGLAAAVPMVCAGAVLIDTYSGAKVSKLIGMINAVITAAMAAAPVVGAYLSEAYGWRANFVAVMIISIIAFLFFLLFIEESLPISLRRKLNLVAILKDYLTISKSLPFLCYCLLACYPFITIVVYITNLSVIFVNHLGMALEDYSYYQATTMGVFVIFSYLSVWMIGKKGLDFTKNLGGIISIIGTVSLFLVSVLDYTNAVAICISMGILAAGGSLMSGTFGMKTLSIFPEMNGTALAACTVIRLFLVAMFVFVSEIYFDGTILPVALIIVAYAAVSLGLYVYLIKSGIIKLNQGEAA